MQQTPHPPVDTSELPDQSPHYVRAVTEMGEEREILAHADIVAINGMKLLAKGARINGSQYDRLNLHKLRVPLDLVLTTEQAVDANHLAADGDRLLAHDPAMARMVQRAGDPLGFKQVLGAMHLPEPLRFRLTVMREKRNALFQHSLRCALISHSLAVRLDMTARRKEELMLAALCHDLGEMHTDPGLLEPGHRITPQERCFIHVHPITSYMLLREIPGIPHATLQGVLQHHERLDGSGYPHGLAGKAIHPLAKLLSLADVMEAVQHRADIQRLDVLLRLNRLRFDPAAIGVLHELLRADAINAQAAPVVRNVLLRMTRLVDVFDAWQHLYGQGDMKARMVTDFDFLQERMDLMRSLMLQVGIEHEDMAALMEMARQDSTLLRELQATLDELAWLMRDIANEIERRAEGLESQSRDLACGLVALLKTASEGS